MIPANNTLLTTNLKVVSHKSKTYRMELDSNRIRGYADGQESVKQAIYKILNTERYRYIIYSWNYGIELADLFGKPKDYVCSEVKRRIIEALMIDDRITLLDEFEFDITPRHTVIVYFTAHTIFGDLRITKEVNGINV